MFKKEIISTMLLFISFSINSQLITGKIVSQKSLKAIENVAVTTDVKTGTTSNHKGNYVIELKNVSSITFSCLGYQSKTITINQFLHDNYIVYLNEKVNTLDEILLSTRKISLDSIVAKTLKNMKTNYISTPLRLEIYTVESQKVMFKNLDITLKSSSFLPPKELKFAVQKLDSFSNMLLTNTPTFTSEFKVSVLNSEITPKNSKKKIHLYKINDIEGYKYQNFSKEITLKDMEQKLQSIISTCIDTTKSYKIKTGLFQIEDSLSFKKLFKLNDSLKNANGYYNFYGHNYLSDLQKAGTFFNHKKETNFLNTKYYKHSLEKKEVLGTTPCYVISFQPKIFSSKYWGKIYVNASDFSVKKVEYQFAKGKRGEHLNLKFLLGIKYAVNLHSVILWYEKNNENKIYTSYFKSTTNNYAYINRPIKFIENKTKKNRAKFNLKLEIDVTDSKEVYVSSCNSLTSDKEIVIHRADITKKIKFMTEETYNNTNWKNRFFIKNYLNDKTPTP